MSESTILCRIGGKRPIRDLIREKAPNDFTTYIEPFVGSGVIYLHLDLDGKTAIINDIDDTVIDSWKIIKSNPKSDDINKYDKMTEDEIQTFAYQTHDDPSDQLVANLHQMCGTFAGKGSGKIYRFRKIKPRLNKIESLSKYMKNTTLLKEDYKTVIEQYDNPNSFFYLDPPYERKDKMYKKDDINYKELANILKTLKGKFLMSINDSENIQNIFKDFKINPVNVLGRGHCVSKTKPIGSGYRKELLITNY